MATELSPLAKLLADELRQRSESGYDVTAVRAELDHIDHLDTDLAPERARRLLDRLATLPHTPGWSYVEPSTRPEIEAELPPPRPAARQPIGAAELRDRIEAGWLGRCAGSCLGKPVSNADHWTRALLRTYLEESGNYPIRDYLRRLDPMPEGFVLDASWPESTKGRIRQVPRNDALDYTLLGLHVLETRGFSFVTADVAAQWLLRLPFHLTDAAERATYRNLVNGVEPVLTAIVDNPYREWAGAQLRADVFGYVCAGRPRAAALMAFDDAALSHVGNGIYAEMWAAAAVAAAFTAASMREAVVESVDHVPRRSRLAEALHRVVDLRASNASWDDAVASLDQCYGHYHWQHAVRNVAACALGLLYADDDYSRAIGLTVQAGLHSDGNGATAGSVAGVFAGRGGISRHWTASFDDIVRSGVYGFDKSSVRDVADRTFALARTYTSQRLRLDVEAPPRDVAPHGPRAAR